MSGLVKLVCDYRRDCRPRIHALMEQYPEKQYLIFRTREQAEAWLCKLNET